MREYSKVSKGVIFAIVIAVIVIGVSLISLFSLGKGEPESGGKQLAGSVNYLDESNSIEEASTSSDKTINEVKENKIALNTEKFVNSQNTNTVQKQTNTTTKTIIMNKKNIGDAVLEGIEQALNVGTIEDSQSSSSKVDVTVILGRDYN